MVSYPTLFTSTANTVTMMNSKNRVIEIRVNGVVLSALRTETAVAADYISFMETLTSALMHRDSLEREANASGRTMNHHNFGALGSLPITDPKGL